MEYKYNTNSNMATVIIKLFPGTRDWLERQDNPDGVVQAALIEYRQKHGIQRKGKDDNKNQD